MNARDYLLAYIAMGMAYSLPKLFGFLDFLRNDPDWHEEIPGAAWVVSLVASVIITSAALVLAATWPFWMVKNLFSRGK
jgi:hypothetical protein